MYRIEIYVAMTAMLWGVVSASALSDAPTQPCHHMPLALTAGSTRDTGPAPLEISLTSRNQFTALRGGAFVGTNLQVGYQRGGWAALVWPPRYRTAVDDAANAGATDAQKPWRLRLALQLGVPIIFSTARITFDVGYA